MPETDTTSGARALVGVAAVAAVALFGALQQYAIADAYSARFHDPYQVLTQQERLAPVLARIPESAPVGYLSDLPVNEELGRAGYFVTQYAVAPRLLVRHDIKPAPEWVVGYFSKRLDYAVEGQSHGLLLAEDLGAAVVLYRREGR